MDVVTSVLDATIKPGVDLGHSHTGSPNITRATRASALSRAFKHQKVTLLTASWPSSRRGIAKPGP